MRRAILRVFHLCVARRNAHSIASPNLNTRVFLSAYMVHFGPDFVFETVDGESKKELMEAAWALIESFHRICEELQTKAVQDVDRALVVDFPPRMVVYVQKFKAWKIPDEDKLACRIKHALSALYAARDQVCGAEPSNSKLVVEFEAQQERLRFKLLQCAGKGVLKAFDEENGRAHLPAPTAHSAGNDPYSTTREASKTTSKNMYSTLPGRMTNEQLAHELLIDPKFKLDEKGGSDQENPVFARIREGFHVAFWDSLVDDLRLTPPCYVRVVRVISEVRDGIIELASGTKEEASIKSAVNVDAVKTTLKDVGMQWGPSVALLEGVVDVVKKMQAPMRDVETREQWIVLRKSFADAEFHEEEQPAAFCRGLEFILDRVNLMRIDCANARLRMIAPVIKLHGPEYERAHMERRIKAAAVKEGGVVGGAHGGALRLTSEWISKAVIEVGFEVVYCCSWLSCGMLTSFPCCPQCGKDMSHTLMKGMGVDFMAVHMKAVMGLVAGSEDITADNCPETLKLDVHRLQACRVEFNFVVLGSTAMCKLQALGPKSSTAQMGALSLLSAFFLEYIPRSGDDSQIQKGFVEFVNGRGVAFEEGHREAALCVLQQSKEASDPVRLVMGGPK